jgi:hypothetical protein
MSNNQEVQQEYVWKFEAQSIPIHSAAQPVTLGTNAVIPSPTKSQIRRGGNLMDP